MSKKGLLIIFLVALSLRLIFWVFLLHHPERAFDNDSKGYLFLAGTLLDSHTFPSILRTPVYPFFIASIYSLFGKFPQAVLLFQYVLDSGTAVVVALLFFRIFQNPGYSLLAGILYAINPFAIFYSQMILAETVFTFIFASTTFFFIVFLQSGQRTYLITSSLVMGVAIFCRPIAFYTPLLLVPCVFCVRYKLRDRIMSALIFLMISFMALMPWYMKNYRDYGRWTLSTIGDLNYFVSFAPEVLMIKDDPLSVATFNVNEKVEQFKKVLWLSAKEKYGWHEDRPSEIRDDTERFALLLQEGKRVVYENAPIFLVSHLLNIGRVLCPYHPYFERIVGNNSTIISGVSFMADFFIMGFFMVGLVISLRGAFAHKFDNIPVLIMVILIVYFSSIPGIVGYSRFRVPILPYISIFSALGVQKIMTLRQSGK